MPNRPDSSGLVLCQGAKEIVEHEVDGLSRDRRRELFKFVGKIYLDEVKYEGCKVWHPYRGVPVFLSEIEGEILVFAAERATDGNPKISVLFAGTRNEGYSGSFGKWDGTDDDALWDVVQRRCQLHFHP